MMYGKYVDTQAGKLYLAVEDGAVVLLGRDGAETADVPQDGVGMEETLRLSERAAAQLQEYMLGLRRQFDIPMRVKGTPFQEKVWAALCRIPYGKTRTYGEIAAEVGSPKGARAVGMACNRNPVMILIPCHRVIGSTGALVGFGGGLDMKEYLLRLEKSSAETTNARKTKKTSDSPG